MSLIFRDAHVDDPAGAAAITLFAVATVLTAVGFIAAGVAVARAGRWTSWRRYTALAVGIWLLCLIPLQFTSLLPLAVVVFAVTMAASAIALLAEPEGTGHEPPHTRIPGVAGSSGMPALLARRATPG